jgi:hypothetical protein
VTAPVELLHRAARCYLAAGLADDACRCFEGAGDAVAAARLHEQQQRWEPAATGYAAAGAWADAARCWLRCARPAAAADCLVKAGDPLRAAWVFADQAGLHGRARSLLAQVADESAGAQLGAELVRARCEAGTGAHDPAARRLRHVLDRLREPPAAPARPATAGAEEEGRRAAAARDGPRRPAVVGVHTGELIDWALAVAEALRRPDLGVLTHAAATAVGMPGAEQRWERWALATLGDAAGVPVREAPEDGADDQGSTQKPAATADAAGADPERAQPDIPRPEPEP